MTTETTTTTTPGGAALPSFGEAFKVWLKIGCLSFGGPAGQIAMMHRVLVDEKKWVDEPRFLHALNFCVLSPGPEAQKLATYIGWLMHGVRGGLAAGILFVLPGAFVMLGLSLLYALGRGIPIIDGALFGIKAAVLVIVVEALIRIGKRALKTSLLLAHRGRGLRRHLFHGDPVSGDRDRGGAHRLPGRALVARHARLKDDVGALTPARAGPLAAGGDGVGDRAGSVVGAGRAGGAGARSEPRAHQYRVVLLETCGGELRRRLCAARLHGAAGG